MRLIPIAAPTVEPLTLAEVKAFCRVTHDREDALLERALRSARRQGEAVTGRAFLTQTWDLVLPGFGPGPLRIPLPPLQSVTSISYVDLGGVTRLWDEAHYVVEGAYPPTGEVMVFARPATVRPVWTEDYPLTRPQVDAVTIRFVAGYGDEAARVPDGLKLDLLQLAFQVYERRPATLEDLFGPYRVTWGVA